MELNWELYPGLVKLNMMGDGSCFFHSIAYSFHKPYRFETIEGYVLDRRDFIRKLRKDLSIKLGQPVNPSDPNSPIYYDVLSRGQLSELSKTLPEYSLLYMQKELDSNTPIDSIYHEFVSDILNKDIYILDGESRDVYQLDRELYYKGRPSIVLYYANNHYDLIGLNTKVGENSNDNGIKTFFNPNSDFIRILYSRLK